MAKQPQNNLEKEKEGQNRRFPKPFISASDALLYTVITIMFLLLLYIASNTQAAIKIVESRYKAEMIALGCYAREPLTGLNLTNVTWPNLTITYNPESDT